MLKKLETYVWKGWLYFFQNGFESFIFIILCSNLSKCYFDKLKKTLYNFIKHSRDWN
jgi:hypothetical protein